jgi:hypothetical protein
MKPSTLLLAASCLLVLPLLSSCLGDDDATFEFVLGPPPAHMQRIEGDMDVHKAKVKLNLKKESAYDAKQKAGLKTSFASEIDIFDQSSSVQLTGKLTDNDGFGAQASKTVWPTKINKKGNRMKWIGRKYGFGTRSAHHKGGNPITRLLALFYSHGKGRTYLIGKVRPKNKGNNESGWMQYYSTLQDTFGNGKVSETINGEMNVQVNGASSRRRGAAMSEMHTLSGPVGLFGKNGKLKIGAGEE